MDVFDPQPRCVKYGSIVARDSAGSTWKKNRCGTGNSLNPKPGDEMKAEAVPPPLAACEEKRHNKKSLRGRKKKKNQMIMLGKK